MNHHQIQRILTFTVYSTTSNLRNTGIKLARRIEMLRKQIRTMDPAQAPGGGAMVGEVRTGLSCYGPQWACYGTVWRYGHCIAGCVIIVSRCFNGGGRVCMENRPHE